MLNDAGGFDHIYIAVGYTDLRRGIDGLKLLVSQTFDLDPYQNSLFLFCGRRTGRIKALLWEGDGFLLLYKRLDTGKFQWPRSETELREIAGAEASAIMFSMCETARANNLKPYEYFKYLLEEMPKHMKASHRDMSFLEDLLPWSEALPPEIRKSESNNSAAS